MRVENCSLGDLRTFLKKGASDLPRIITTQLNCGVQYFLWTFPVGHAHFFLPAFDSLWFRKLRDWARSSVSGETVLSELRSARIGRGAPFFSLIARSFSSWPVFGSSSESADREFFEYITPVDSDLQLALVGFLTEWNETFQDLCYVNCSVADSEESAMLKFAFESGPGTLVASEREVEHVLEVIQSLSDPPELVVRELTRRGIRPNIAPLRLDPANGKLEIIQEIASARMNLVRKAMTPIVYADIANLVGASGGGIDVISRMAGQSRKASHVPVRLLSEMLSFGIQLEANFPILGRIVGDNRGTQQQGQP